MSNTALPTHTPDTPEPLLDSVFGELWRDPRTPGRPRLVGASLAVGLLAAIVVPWRTPGLGTFLVLVAIAGVVAAAGRSRRTVEQASSALICLLLVSTVMLRDAAWIVVLCMLAAFTIGSVALCRGRSVPGLVASTFALPVAGVRGLPWLARSLSTSRRTAHMWPLLRTVLLSVVLVVVFGTLFASADAIFARWVQVLVPDLSLDGFAVRVVVLVAAAGSTLAGVFVALAPPAVGRLTLPATAAVRRFEWAVPVGLVIGTFVVFLVAQLTALYGGHEYVRRTTGMTYADYVHQGFGQLTIATALTLAIIGAVVRRASRESATDRAWLRVLLGMLCGLTLVVVGSALSRMHVYEEAYGFTRLRLLVSVFEAWLGVVLVLVLVAGIRIRGRWVPRAALFTGAAMLLGLAALNPDGYVAERNIERFEQTGKIDVSYLQGLSDDAVPALAELPERVRACALQGTAIGDEDWLEWNVGRLRAARALDGWARQANEVCSAQRPEMEMPERVL